MTHDLVRNIINQLGGVVQRVTVTEMRENTFFALIDILLNDQHLLIDARPSDAIALALVSIAPSLFAMKSLSVSRLADESQLNIEVDDPDEEVEWPEELEDISDYRM
jgi:bifunctional DNase/RNase